MDGWKITYLFGKAYFQGRAVSFREGNGRNLATLDILQVYSVAFQRGFSVGRKRVSGGILGFFGLGHWNFHLKDWPKNVDFLLHV